MLNLNVSGETKYLTYMQILLPPQQPATRGHTFTNFDIACSARAFSRTLVYMVCKHVGHPSREHRESRSGGHAKFFHRDIGSDSKRHRNTTTGQLGKCLRVFQIR